MALVGPPATGLGGSTYSYCALRGRSEADGVDRLRVVVVAGMQFVNKVPSIRCQSLRQEQNDH